MVDRFSRDHCIIYIETWIKKFNFVTNIKEMILESLIRNIEYKIIILNKQIKISFNKKLFRIENNENIKFLILIDLWIKILVISKNILI
jgi:hypothetical protein